MKKLLYFLLALPFLASGQDQNQNYIKTTTYSQANAVSVTNPVAAIAQVKIVYYDGLGRPMQEKAYRASASGKDIITHVEYDYVGRQVREYLPYVNGASTIGYETGAAANIFSFYAAPTFASTGNPNFEATANAYTEKQFEFSPLNRVQQQAAPGNTWSMANGHTTRMDYLSNTADNVKQFVAVSNWNSIKGLYETQLENSTGTVFYTDGELYKTITKDENWTAGKTNTVEEFTNKQGQVVLKRTYVGTTPYDTYYVYDQFSNLSFVIPPKADASVTAQVLIDLCYQYFYDLRDRIVEKKLPGKEVEYTVYDKLDRPILTQDGNLRALSKWSFTKYDSFGRIAYTGLWSSPLTRFNEQATVTNQPTPIWNETRQIAFMTIGSAIFPAKVYYSDDAYPKASGSLEVLTINYYDNYVFDLQGLVSETSFGITPITAVKSILTGSKTRILGTNSWTTDVSYYDSEARSIFTVSKNDYLGTTNKVKSKLDFKGKVLEAESTHLKGSSTLVVSDKFTYDTADRLLTQKQTINTQAEQLIVKNTYDELGTLVKKQVGNTEANPLQTIDFAYNVRGWLKDINDISRAGNDLFSYNIGYQDNNSPYVSGDNVGKPLYNGNISMINWNTDNSSPGMRAYFYKYDGLNRFLSTQYSENDIVNNKYVEGATYDKNGNILQLGRNSQSTTNPAISQFIDNLTYVYSGNQLLSVTDSYGQTAAGVMGFKDGNIVGNDYGYDSNSNMTGDKNKDITLITYNHLNLPVKIVFSNADIGSASPKVIEFKYDGAGAKIEKKVTEFTTITTTQYAGNYSYQNDVLQFFPHSEGYVSNVAGVFKYVFQYKDHLGNTRLSYADSDGNGSITGASSELFYSGFENSGWESASDPYHYGGAVTYDTTKKHSGNASGRIGTPPVDQELYVQTNTRMAVSNTVPTQYLFSGWVYCDNNMLSADLLLIEYKAGETLYNTRAEELRTREKNRWVYIQKLVTVQPDIVELALRVDNNGGGIVWFDDVNLRKINTVNEIVEENNYYPFGLRHPYGNFTPLNNANVNAQKYKYNGKELQEELGLNMYDMGARGYMPDIGRFTVIDPMADFVNYQSPYVMSNNNPIINVDEYGLGIFNVIGNLFSRLWGFISNIGNPCSCNSRTQESVGGAWSRPDFPGVNAFINDLFSGDGRNRNIVRPTSGVKQRTKEEGTIINPAGLVIGDNTIGSQNVNIPIPATQNLKLSKPKSKRIPMLGNRKTAIFNRDIEFESSSSKINISLTEKTLRDLVKTLIDYPQLIVSISANVAVVTDKPINSDTGIRVDGQNGTVGGLQLARATAIRHFLISRGVNPKQVSIGLGVIRINEGDPGATFKLTKSN